MKRGLVILSLLVISLLLISSVSAFSLNDFFKNFWQKITGKVTENLAPTATLSTSPLSGEAPLTVYFTISCSDPDTDPGNYLAICSVEYGDNSVAPYVSEGGKPVSKTIQHTYSSAGTYTVVLKAVDYKMLESKKELTITVSKAATQSPTPTASPSATPTASPTASPSQVCIKQGAICTDKYGKHSDFCSSETEINKFVCQNNLCVRQAPTQCSAGLVCSKNENKCVKEAIVLNGYLQVATIKDTYNIGEKVELTDPPEDENYLVAEQMLDTLLGIGKKEQLPQYVSSEILIKFKKDPEIKKTFFISRWLLGKEKISTNIDSINKLNKQYKVDDFEKVLKIKPKDTKIIEKTANLYKLKIKSNENLMNIIEDYKSNPTVESVQPNYLYYTSLIPNDPRYGEQWAHVKTQAEQVWDIEQGSSDVVIAIIDTGVDYNHEDLAENIWYDENGNPGYDFVDIDFEKEYKPYGYGLIEGEDYTTPDSDPSDFNGHGTHCAGIAAAVGNNAKGVIGVCPKCKIMPVRAGFSIIYRDGIYGLLESDDIVNAIYYAADNDAEVISMSFGGEGEMPDEEKEALDYAYNKGAILIAAAGNSDTDQLSYPAGYDSVIAVAATDQSDYKAYFSNYGYWVNVAAPGVDILSTVPKKGTLSDSSGYMYLSGTSMATPYVAGSVALLKQKNSDWSSEEIKSVLKNTAVDIGEEINVRRVGRIDILKAVSLEERPLISELNFKDYLGISGIVDFYGTAKGDNFERYEISYSKKGEETWNLICSGNKPVENGFLCGNFDSYSLNTGFGLIRLKAISLSGKGYLDYLEYFRNDPSVRVLFDSKAPIFQGSIVTGDIDGDGNKEVIFATSEIPDSDSAPRLYAINNDGEVLNGFPIKIVGWNGFFGETVFTAPSVADIDNNGIDDIVLASGDEVYVVDGNGEMLEGYPLKINGANLVGVTVSDIDNDRDKEIITQDRGDGERVVPKGEERVMGIAYIIKSNGEVQDGFPVELDVIINNPLAVGDVNNDGLKEIVYAGWIHDEEDVHVGQIGIIDINGIHLEGWPKKIYRNRDGEIWSQLVYSPILSDLNQDGYLEILVADFDYGDFYFYDYEGNLLPEWDNALGERLVWSKIVITNLEGDKDPEIIITTRYPPLDPKGKIFVLDNHGKVLRSWEEEVRGFWEISFPVTGGLSQNNFGILYSDSSTYLNLKDFNGNQIDRWPKYFINTKSPYLEDINNNEMLDVLSFTSDGKILVIEDVFSDSNINWPMFQHDPQHTGCYDCQETQPKPFIKSMINNKGTKTIAGRLVMKAQKQVSGSWQDIKIVVNKQVSVSAEGYLALDKEWANAGYFTPTEAGTYRINAFLLNSAGEIIQTTQGKLESSYEFKVV